MNLGLSFPLYMVLRIEPRTPGLPRKHLYSPSYLAGLTAILEAFPTSLHCNVYPCETCHLYSPDPCHLCLSSISSSFHTGSSMPDCTLGSETQP